MVSTGALTSFISDCRSGSSVRVSTAGFGGVEIGVFWPISMGCFRGLTGRFRGLDGGVWGCRFWRSGQSRRRVFRASAGGFGSSTGCFGAVEVGSRDPYHRALARRRRFGLRVRAVGPGVVGQGGPQAGQSDERTPRQASRGANDERRRAATGCVNLQRLGDGKDGPSTNPGQ